MYTARPICSLELHSCPFQCPSSQPVQPLSTETSVGVTTWPPGSQRTKTLLSKGIPGPQRGSGGWAGSRHTEPQWPRASMAPTRGAPLKGPWSRLQQDFQVPARLKSLDSCAQPEASACLVAGSRWRLSPGSCCQPSRKGLAHRAEPAESQTRGHGCSPAQRVRQRLQPPHTRAGWW